MAKKKYDPAAMRTMVDGEEDMVSEIPEGEMTTSPEVAATETKTQEAKKQTQSIKASEAEIPALGNLQPGDSMDLNVAVKVLRKGKDGNYDLEITDIYSTEEQAAQEPAAAPMGGAGDLGSMLAGIQGQG